MSYPLWYIESRETYKQTHLEPASRVERLFAECEIVINYNKLHEDDKGISICQYFEDCLIDGGKVSDLRDEFVSVDGVRMEWEKAKDLKIHDKMVIYIHSGGF